tara:strand:+ start:349 stop:582 length:234 start_codon:yes stop_codon:yes gene_type:complete
MIDVQAAPKTHPGGSHGALTRDMYHSDVGPSFIRRTPINRAPIFSVRKAKKVAEVFINCLDFQFYIKLLVLGSIFDH